MDARTRFGQLGQLAAVARPRSASSGVDRNGIAQPMARPFAEGGRLLAAHRAYGRLPYRCRQRCQSVINKRRQQHRSPNTHLTVTSVRLRRHRRSSDVWPSRSPVAAGTVLDLTVARGAFALGPWQVWLGRWRSCLWRFRGDHHLVGRSWSRSTGGDDCLDRKESCQRT